MIRVSEAPSPVVEAVIEDTCPGLASEDFRRLAHFSKGFPKIGRLVAQAWVRSRPVAHATEEHLAETFVVGHQTHEGDKLLKSARLLAAFPLVRMDQPNDDLSEVAEFGRDLSAKDLRSMFVRLIERGVARRRGRFVTLQPPAIAARLAERQWRDWCSAEWYAILGGRTSLNLKVNAAKQLALLNTIGLAREVVEPCLLPKRSVRRTGRRVAARSRRGFERVSRDRHFSRSRPDRAFSREFHGSARR